MPHKPKQAQARGASMIVGTYTSPFTPVVGSDWSPTVSELTVARWPLRGLDLDDHTIRAPRAAMIEMLQTIHADGLSAFSVHLNRRRDTVEVWFSVTVGSDTGFSRQASKHLTRNLSDIGNADLCPRPGYTPGPLDAESPMSVIRILAPFAVSPLALDRRWTWDSLTQAISDSSVGTTAAVAMIATSDVRQRFLEGGSSTQQMSSLWAGDLLIATPERLASVDAARLSRLICDKPAPKRFERLTSRTDVAAFHLGVPVVGGTRRRIHRAAASHDEVTGQMGILPLQMRLGDESAAPS